MIDFPKKLQFLFKPKRFKVAYGGRGGSKSWGFSRALLVIGAERPIRALCARETQKSITDSVHKLLSDQIAELNLGEFYAVQETKIIGKNGTEFIFAGIKQNIHNLKSYEGCDICWVEEAQTVSKHSWDVLIPTIRKENSEIWISFNPDLETDETYRRFVLDPQADPKNHEDFAVVKINWSDNPWFPEVLRKEKDRLKIKDPDSYEHIWEGMCQQMVEGAIYRKQLLEADKAGRIASVPYVSGKPVDTFWDLGYGDSSAIWFAQTIGMEFHIIDFTSGQGQELAWYLRQLQEKPYVYGTYYLPHDAQQKQLAAGGRSIEMQLGATGRQVRIVPKIDKFDGIEAARAIFNRCWFDAQKCADGLQALRHYQFEKDEDRSLPDKPAYKREPLHNWASHAADAFRYLAVSIKEADRMPPGGEFTPPNYGSAGWMA